MPVLLAVLLPAMHACKTSPHPQQAARADTPRGASVGVHLLDGQRHVGELLAVQDSSLVILLPANRVAVGRFADVGRVDWGDYASSRNVSTSVWRSPTLRQQGLSASRFPYGLTQPAWRTLLARFGQTSPDTLRVERR
jgi:hypothetical protein